MPSRSGDALDAAPRDTGAMATQSSSALVALSNELAAAVERVAGAIVSIDARRRTNSSGIVWRDGVIVTADHTLERDDEIELLLADGRTTAASIAGRDPSTDLAILKPSVPAALPIAEPAEPASLRVGELVLAVGRPGEGGPSATLGVISALDGPWRTWRGGEIERFVRADVSLYPGFSGGPLVTIDGRVLGLNTTGLSRRTAVTIPATTVSRVVDVLLSGGRIRRGYLGIAMQPVRIPDRIATDLGLDDRGGVIVVDVEPNGPADRAGLLIGDVIVRMGETRVRDADDLQIVLGANRVGAALAARIVRGGTAADLTVTVGERPHGDD
jgi:serine protease DegQ